MVRRTAKRGPKAGSQFDIDPFVALLSGGG
jgi:hypothetical protein